MPQFRLVHALTFLSLTVAGTKILFSFDPAHYNFYPGCLFRAITGLNCPGCGSLRAIHELLHGHVAAALQLNLLLVFSLPVCVWLVMHEVAAWLRGQPLTLEISRAWLWVFLTFALVFAVVRNLPGFDWLRA